MSTTTAAAYDIGDVAELITAKLASIPIIVAPKILSRTRATFLIGGEWTLSPDDILHPCQTPPLGALWIECALSPFSGMNRASVVIYWTPQSIRRQTFETPEYYKMLDTSLERLKQDVVDITTRMKTASRFWMNTTLVPVLVCQLKNIVYLFLGQWRFVNSMLVPAKRNHAIMVRYYVHGSMEQQQQQYINTELSSVCICNTAILLDPLDQFFDFRTPEEMRTADSNYAQVFGQSHLFHIKPMTSIRGYLLGGDNDDFLTHFGAPQASLILGSTVRTGEQNMREYVDQVRDLRYELNLLDEIVVPSMLVSPRNNPTERDRRLAAVLAEQTRIYNENYRDKESRNDPPVESVLLELVLCGRIELTDVAREALERMRISPRAPEATETTTIDEVLKQVTCSVCMANKKDAVTVPCYHNVMCYVCALTILTSDKAECPICRIAIKQVLQIYS